MPVIATPAGWLGYTRAGSGPAVVLVHGLGGSQHTWRFLFSSLAQRHTVIAVDLPGHGDSDSPAAGYSPGAHATALRDLLVKLEIEEATLIGHSLGGGVAMQFAYQHPELVSRLVLISTGGLGREVSSLLRATALPGAGFLLDQMARFPSMLIRAGLSLAGRTPVLSADDVVPLGNALSGAFGNAKDRRTFVREARSVIDAEGQSVSAVGQFEGLAARPLLVIWGSDDRTIPPRHFRELVGRLSGARWAEIPGAGHFPHETAHQMVLPIVEDFLAETPPTAAASARRGVSAL